MMMDDDAVMNDIPLFFCFALYCIVLFGSFVPFVSVFVLHCFNEENVSFFRGEEVWVWEKEVWVWWGTGALMTWWVVTGALMT